MAGLLSPRTQYTGLLGVPPLQSGLADAIAQARALPLAPPPSQAPQRQRVSGLRVLDRVLGGETVSGGLDAERARLEVEAQRPTLQAQQARLRAIAESMGPAATIAYATNPAEFGKALASQSEAYTLSAGGLRGGPGGVVASAPTFTTVNDSVYRNDPGAGTSTLTATAQPGFDDLTARAKAEADAAIARQGVGIQQQNADTTQQVGMGNLGVAQGRLSLEQQEAERKAAAAQVAQSTAQGGSQTVAANMTTALSRARELARHAGYWNGHAPVLSQMNAQGRADLEGQLDTLKGNLTFDKLMEMKRTSPTGASGLGALSDNESRLLASTVAALNVDMSPEELERSFKVIDGVIARATAGGTQGARPIAINPQTGARIQWNGSQWVPL